MGVGVDMDVGVRWRVSSRRGMRCTDTVGKKESICVSAWNCNVEPAPITGIHKYA